MIWVLNGHFARHPRHSESQGSVERSNQDLENMLKNWLKDSINWLLFHTMAKKSSYHRINRSSPYKALFDNTDDKL